MGGLARRAAFIEDLRKKGPVVVADAGDHFFADLMLLDFQVPQLKLKSRVAAKGMKAVGVEVFCPGEADFGAGFAMLQELIGTAGVKVVCANLKHGDALAFEPTTSTTVGALTIGWFGVMKSDRPLPPEGGKPFTIEDPIAAAGKAVEALRARKVDVVVALAHLEALDQEKLAAQVPGIDVILGGHTRDVLPGKTVGGAVIHHPGHQGRQVVLVKVTPQAGKRPHIASQAVDLTLDKPENPELAHAVKQYEKELSALNAKIAPVTSAPVSTEERWWGQQLCGQCHTVQNAFWKTTKHSHAYETLVKRGKATDAECLQCHTAAFGRAKPPNASSIIEVTGFENVQCESCHGPGSDHQLPVVRTMASQRETCVRCHDPKNSPKFDHATWLPKVRCPPGPPVED